MTRSLEGAKKASDAMAKYYGSIQGHEGSDQYRGSPTIFTPGCRLMPEIIGRPGIECLDDREKAQAPLFIFPISVDLNDTYN